MKINKLNILSLLGFLFFCIGCTDDFLSQDPKTQETEEMYFSTFENVEKAVTAAYSRLVFLNYDVMTTMAQNSISDDAEVGGENTADGADWKDMDKLSHDAGNPNLKDMWRVNYKGIRLANTALKYLTLLEEQTDVVIQRTAECKFLRAFYHFELLKFYGGIPITDNVLNPEDFYPARNTVAEVLQFIQKDLEEAYPVLLTKNQLGNNQGRVSKGAAQALLAKAYLYESSYAKNWNGDSRFGDCENKYAKALEMAENVIKSSEYELVGINGERFDSWWGKEADGVTNRTYDGKTNAFRWIFSVGGDNSKESVFEVQNALDKRGWPATRGNGLTVFTTCRYTTAAPSTMYGWGFNVPSNYLLQAFANRDSRETDLSAENKERIAENADPRYFTTIGKEGTEILCKTGIVPTGTLLWTRMKLDNVPTGTAMRKYEAHPDESLLNPEKAANESGPINWKLIRYADVVLMAAEAAYETGNTPKALEYVNMVRKRARNSSDNQEGSLYPKDLSSITFGDIVHERRIEFAMEQSRFFDLVRWNLSEKYMNDLELASFSGIRTSYVKGKHEFFPIPIEQIQLSQGTLVQYDPWK